MNPPASAFDGAQRIEPPPAPETPAQSARDSVLHDALKAVSQRDNEAAYGTGNSFDATARIATELARARGLDRTYTAIDAAEMLLAMKLARSTASGYRHKDSAVDLCGYGAWAHELATREEPTP